MLKKKTKNKDKQHACLEMLIKIHDYGKNHRSVSKHQQPTKVDNAV
jgi:hypothetical protein